MSRDADRRRLGVVGNSDDPARDLTSMGTLDCAACREELSAELDGEADPARRPAVLTHLGACPACTHWREQAAVVTRLTRTAPAEAGPDLVARVLPAAPRPRRRRLAARVALVAVGVAQIVLGALSLIGVAGHGGTMLGGADMAHMSHETAAWNLALGAAFVAGAYWTRHLAGLLPALGAFIVVLGVLSGLDLAAGRVEPDRVATHAVLLLGFALALVVSRTGPARGPSPAPRALAEPEAGPEPGPATAPPAPASRDHLGPVARDRPARREAA
ncbi:zf-HC2 domain-containing protein [Actinomycetospora endophytica]|uniref:Zf-HC2 domain-containing protein n=1 Tax=Actinomycetospora endophytica TaxID=2291215 RepID=A0ABS8P1R7_9PSEU|nr:zf-HC2 domain-containing protein [Actinomycetospora endophytica]MCD2192196.1 zf-HC2 domain-containing protein [Actinomycetospora endophytica]